MSDTDTLVVSDDKPVYEAWRAGGTNEELAYTATQKVRDMAAVNVLAFMGAKFAALDAKLDAQAAAHDARFAALDANLAAQAAAHDANLAALDAKLDASLAAQSAKIEATQVLVTQFSSSVRWMFGTVLAIVTAMMVLVVLLVDKQISTAAVQAPAAAENATVSPGVIELAPAPSDPDGL